MKSSIRLSVVLLVCGVGVGLAVGYKLALLREHERLQHNSDFTVHDWMGDHAGMDALAEGLRYTQADYLDWKESAVSIVAEGDYVAARLVSGGTQARDLEAVPHISPVIPNKHRSLQMSEMTIFRVADGKLAEQWITLDGWDASIQLGLFDPDHWKESICGETANP